MALYAGEAVRVRARLIDPEINGPFVVRDEDPDPTAKLWLWAPGKSPRNNLDHRQDHDHGPEDMEYRPETNDFILFVHTRGEGMGPSEGEKWQSGRWSFRVEVTGNAFRNWEYGTFNLRP